MPRADLWLWMGKVNPVERRSGSPTTMSLNLFIQSLYLEGFTVGVLDKILRAGEGKTLRKLE